MDHPRVWFWVQDIIQNHGIEKGEIILTNTVYI